MRNKLQYLVIFLIGFIAYPALEIVWRGYTHWTMALTGGIVFLFLYNLSRTKMAVWKKCLIGAGVVTGIEFIVGVIVNIGFGWKVWDYSAQPANILGQICPMFFILWVGLCLPAEYLCRAINKRFDFF